jgi:phosphate transport system protein
MPGNQLPILGVSDVMKLLVQQKREALREGLLGMGEMVVAALRQAIDCLRGRNLELAREIVVNDNKINQFRRLAEQQALVALAAYQPAGDDFREIGATLELVSELERMADHAKDVARLV